MALLRQYCTHYYSRLSSLVVNTPPHHAFIICNPVQYLFNELHLKATEVELNKLYTEHLIKHRGTLTSIELQ